MAIASLGVFGLRVSAFWFFNKKGIDNAQLARVGLDWEGFGWFILTCLVRNRDTVATVYSDVSSLARAGVCSCALPGLLHACSAMSSLLLPVRGSRAAVL